ncbi:DUF6795 domain-containing protein [Gynuella sunshinyii]|uniref:DUF6795 domain-containing protein n=1 Tax=Gynuella sunshinyii TaxID=1445505 RepID=UPI0005CBCF4A|nr:DUF6795 domain-containing protein [Gynuella sunshinyii]
MNKATILVFISFLIGCAPIPHAAKIEPEISGQILFNGFPANGAEVTQCISHNGNKCTKHRSVLTDNNGRFKLKARREFRWYVTLLGDEMFAYGFSVVYNGVSYQGCSGSDLGVLENVSDVKYELTSKNECNLSLGW